MYKRRCLYVYISMYMCTCIDWLIHTHTSICYWWCFSGDSPLIYTLKCVIYKIITTKCINSCTQVNLFSEDIENSSPSLWYIWTYIRGLIRPVIAPPCFHVVSLGLVHLCKILQIHTLLLPCVPHSDARESLNTLDSLVLHLPQG